MIRLVLIIGVLSAAVLASPPAPQQLEVQEAQAHFPGWAIHKALCAVGVGCRDIPPKPGPRHPCTPGNSGEIAIVWDPILEANVKWRCLCVETGCRWVRVEIMIQPLPWQTMFCFRYVVDFHRSCRSIVCNFHGVEHRYRVRGSFFNPGCFG